MSDEIMKNRIDGDDIDEEEEDIITLEFDDGTAVDCFVAGVFDMDDKSYIVLEPDDGTDDIYIYRYIVNDDDSWDIEDILDEDEFNAAAAELEAIYDSAEEE